MTQPMTWNSIKTLIDANTAFRFRIKEPDEEKRLAILKIYTKQFMGRWGYMIEGESIILGIEDIEDLNILKSMFYNSRKKKPVTSLKSHKAEEIQRSRQAAMERLEKKKQDNN